MWGHSLLNILLNRQKPLGQAFFIYVPLSYPSTFPDKPTLQQLQCQGGLKGIRVSCFVKGLRGSEVAVLWVEEENDSLTGKCAVRSHCFPLVLRRLGRECCYHHWGSKVARWLAEQGSCHHQGRKLIALAIAGSIMFALLWTEHENWAMSQNQETSHQPLCVPRHQSHWNMKINCVTSTGDPSRLREIVSIIYAKSTKIIPWETLRPLYFLLFDFSISYVYNSKSFEIIKIQKWL